MTSMALPSLSPRSTVRVSLKAPTAVLQLLRIRLDAHAASLVAVPS